VKSGILAPIFIIIVVALLAYSNSFAVPFVYDDLGNIVGNAALEDFDLLDLKSYADFRSLPQASLAMNVQLAGIDSVWHFHAVNLVIHIVNGLLVFWLSLLLFRCSTSPTNSAGRRNT